VSESVFEIKSWKRWKSEFWKTKVKF
jgi:hypothetical protein